MPYQFILLIKLQWQVVVDRSILTGVKIWNGKIDCPMAIVDIKYR
jgi:hypothetical protein